MWPSLSVMGVSVLSSQRKVSHEKIKQKFIWEDKLSKERLQWQRQEAAWWPMSLALEFFKCYEVGSILMGEDGPFLIPNHCGLDLPFRVLCVIRWTTSQRRRGADPWSVHACRRMCPS